MFGLSRALVPFLIPLGWGVGYAVTTGMKRVFDRYFPRKDVDDSSSGQTDPAGEVCSKRAMDVCEDFDSTEALKDSTSEERTVFRQTNPAGEVCPQGHTVASHTNVTGLRATTVDDNLRRERTVVEKTDPAGEDIFTADLEASGFAEVLASAVLAKPEMSSFKGTFTSVFEVLSSQCVSEGNGVDRDIAPFDLSKSWDCEVSVVIELNCSPSREAQLTGNSGTLETCDMLVTVPEDKATPAGVTLSGNESKVFGDSFINAPKGITDPAGEVNHLEQLAGSDVLDVVKSAQQGLTVREDPENFYKFSNVFSNSWMNASFQAILNLSVTRRCLARERVFIEASSVPCCAHLLHSAVRHPGKHISPEEISPVLTELRERSLVLGSDFEISCLLESLLVWLDSLGGETARELYSVGSCTCGMDYLERLSNGPLIVLPPSTAIDNITSLFKYWVELAVTTLCSGCGSKVRHQHCLTDNNILAFFLPQSARCNKKLKILPNATMDVSGECGKAQYHLSSVICRGSDPADFYTYLIDGEQTVKAVDEHVFTADSCCSEDMFRRGFLFLYEKN